MSASAAVFELVWWPFRCFSQAWAPQANSSTDAIRVAVNRRCMAKKLLFKTLGAQPLTGAGDRRLRSWFRYHPSVLLPPACLRSRPNAAAAATLMAVPWAGLATAATGAPCSVPIGPCRPSAPVGAPSQPSPGADLAGGSGHGRHPCWALVPVSSKNPITRLGGERGLLNQAFLTRVWLA